MYRSKEKLLESVDEIETSYRSRLKGIANRSFDCTTESSIHSAEDGQSAKVQVEVYQPTTTTTTSIPVPLPRSKIPRLLSSRAKESPSEPTKPSKLFKSTAQKEKDALIERDSTPTEVSLPLTTFVVNNEKVKQKKSKRTNIEESSTTTIQSTEDLSTTDLDDKRDDPVATDSDNKKIKRRRRKKKPSNLERSRSIDSFIGFYVHDLEFLKFVAGLESVHVRVSCYDQSNGHLLGRLRRQDHPVPGEIQPLVSKRCRFEAVNYLHCVWEELLLVEENVRVLRTENSIIFFEIIVQLESAIDFKTVAWAFLKPFHADRFDNIDKRHRLQVYHFNARMSLFQNWRNTKRHRKYPSTLSITLKSVTPARNNEEESKGAEKDDVPEKNPFDVSAATLACQKNFKCPNQVVSALKLSGKGTNLLKINPSSDLVAITNPSENSSSSQIIICTVPDLKVVQKLEGHSKVIYGLDWKKSATSFPQTLISCSADRTALLWTIDRHFNYTVHVLPHVTFIYSCCFWTHHGRDFILTAGKDSILRVWSPFKGSFTIHQEMSKGTGYITCLTVASNSTIYSGDSEGRVVEWRWTGDCFECSRTIHEDREIICHLEVHPRIRNLFIGTQTGGVMSMNLESRIIIQCFEKGHRGLFKFRISNCGTYLLTNGGGQEINCWNILTNTEEGSFDFLPPSTPGCTFSCIDVARKGSFVIIGRYRANKNAVLLVSNSSSRAVKSESAPRDPIHHLRDTEEQTTVKNKLSEIIEKLDQVFVLPQLCDDEKISMSQDMVNEKKRIEEWLDRNVVSEESDGDGGTFVVQRQESVKSNGTFTVEKEEEEHPKEEITRKKPKRRTLVKESNTDLLSGEKSAGSGGTYEIKKRSRDTDADDTSISDSIFA